MHAPPPESALPNSSRRTRLLPPTQRTSLRSFAIAIVLLLLGFVPYPSQVFPAITLHLVGPDGQGIHNPNPIHWEGVSNPAIREGEAHFNPDGRVILPAQRIWASGYYRFRAGTGMLHKLRGTRTTLDFAVPDGHTVDAKATDLTDIKEPHWVAVRGYGRVGNDHDDDPFIRVTAGKDREFVELLTLDPSSDPATPLRLVLRETAIPTPP